MEPALDGMRDGKEQMSTGAARSKAVRDCCMSTPFAPEHRLNAGRFKRAKPILYN
jgi:hypothetical protein